MCKPEGGNAHRRSVFPCEVENKVTVVREGGEGELRSPER